MEGWHQVGFRAGGGVAGEGFVEGSRVVRVVAQGGGEGATTGSRAD